MTRRLTLISLGILVFIVLLSLYIVWQGSRTEQRRREAESLLQYERDLSQQLSDVARTIVLVLDCEGRVVNCNHYVEQLTGYPAEELKDRDWFEAMVPEHAREGARSAFKCALGSTRSRAYVNPIVTRHGRERIIEWYDSDLKDASGSIVGMLAIGLDITDRVQSEKEKRHLEDQLHQAQKMEAVGQLASGVAHDFNNLLTVILCNAEMIANRLNHDTAGRAAVETIAEAAQQATGVVRSLLTFSRKLPVDQKPVLLTEVVRESVRILERMLPSTIEVVLDLTDDPPLWINADATQVQQIVLNLVINARDAMPEGGRLRISVMPTALAPGERPGESRNGAGWAKLEIADTGHGMEPGIAARVFEPFFTTKAREQGTGLGLAITHGIVQSHGGMIEVDSERDRGTLFRIFLPRIEPPTGPDGAPRKAEPRRGTGEGILVAEDQRLIRVLLASSLESEGYRVFQAADGEEARETYQRHTNDVNLLILDIDLPRRSGLSVLQEIREAGDDTPTILITGSMEAHFDDDLDPHTVLLAKPFQTGDLTAMVQSMLHPHVRGNVQ